MEAPYITMDPADARERLKAYRPALHMAGTARG